MGFHERFIMIQPKQQMLRSATFSNKSMYLTHTLSDHFISSTSQQMIANTDEQIYIIRMADLINT